MRLLQGPYVVPIPSCSAIVGQALGEILCRFQDIPILLGGGNGISLLKGFGI